MVEIRFALCLSQSTGKTTMMKSMKESVDKSRCATKSNMRWGCIGWWWTVFPLGNRPVAALYILHVTPGLRWNDSRAQVAGVNSRCRASQPLPEHLIPRLKWMTQSPIHPGVRTSTEHLIRLVGTSAEPKPHPQIASSHQGVSHTLRHHPLRRSEVFVPWPRRRIWAYCRSITFYMEYLGLFT